MRQLYGPLVYFTLSGQIEYLVVFNMRFSYADCLLDYHNASTGGQVPLLANCIGGLLYKLSA
jgi:hypothetical protein